MRDTYCFGASPHQLTGIELWRVAWTAMQVEFAVRGGDVLFDQRIFVRRKSINHPIQGLLLAAQPFFQRFYKRFVGQADFLV